MNDENMSELYHVSDLSLCSTLLYLGFTIESTTRESDGRVIFAFRREPHLNDVLSKYWDGSLKVEPKTHFQAIKKLKHRIYNE